MNERLINALHVLDSSVWIDLIDRHSELLYKVVDLANLSVLQIGVPGTVHLEMTRNAPERLAARKKDWHSRVGELMRFAEMLSRTEDPFGPDALPSRSYASALEAMKDSIEEYEGDPHHRMVTDLLCSKVVTSIGEPKAIHAQVVEHGISKKKPYGSRNSTADATILFATARWAERHPDRDVYFHTLNHKDFSDPQFRNTPHPDIAEHFAPSTMLHYSADLRVLAESVEGLDPLDFFERDPDGCDLCEGKVLIDSIVCQSCGCWPSDAPDDEGYTLRPYRGGYLVDVHGYDDRPHRLECDECGKKTFEVYLSSLCSYHQHMTSKD